MTIGMVVFIAIEKKRKKIESTVFIRSIGLAGDDLIPTNRLIMFDYVINTKYIAYSICSIILSFWRNRKEKNVFFFARWVSHKGQCVNLENDKLILFLSSKCGNLIRSSAFVLFVKKSFFICRQTMMWFDMPLYSQ